MSLKQQIEQALTESFKPKNLVVIDESHLHAGHSGWKEAGETHFRIDVEARIFNDMTRVQQHRMINGALSFAFEKGLHALAIASRGAA
jgi:BolA family transcriptional regulator, general stress-responsive regulator